MPMQPRSRIGIFNRPLLMYCILAIWLMISPNASMMKSTNMKSMTGRVPVIAAPPPRPTNPRSAIGVSQRRSAPYLRTGRRSWRSFRRAVRSPRPRRRCGGWRPSRCRAPRAWPHVGEFAAGARAWLGSGPRGLLGVDVSGGSTRLGPRSALGSLGRTSHFITDLGVDRVKFGFGCLA